MKSDYDVLSPFFMKLVGFCVSIFLYILCLKLFVEKPIYIFHKTNAYFVWAITVGAFILCVCFSAFLFMKINNSIVYLLNIYVIYCVKCVLFLLILITYTRSLSEAEMMQRIFLCLGFLFIFLEFLHAQTTRTFIRDKCLLSCTMGITSSVFALAAIVLMFYFNHFSVAHVLALYLLYALRIFVFSLYGKDAKTSLKFKFYFMIFLILLSPASTVMIGIPYYNRLEDIVILETMIIFGCTQLIPLTCGQTSGHIARSPMQKLALHIFTRYCVRNETVHSNDLHLKTFILIKGILMLVLRFVFFTLLATRAANIWGVSW